MAPRTSIIAPEEAFRRSTRYNSRGDLIPQETADTSSSALDLARSVAPTLGIDTAPLDLAQRVAPSLGIDLSAHMAPDTKARVEDITPVEEPPAPGVPEQPLVARQDRNRFDTEAMAAKAAVDLGIKLDRNPMISEMRQEGVPRPYGKLFKGTGHPEETGLGRVADAILRGARANDPLGMSYEGAAEKETQRAFGYGTPQYHAAETIIRPIATVGDLISRIIGGGVGGAGQVAEELQRAIAGEGEAVPGALGTPGQLNAEIQNLLGMKLAEGPGMRAKAPGVDYPGPRPPLEGEIMPPRAAPPAPPQLGAPGRVIEGEPMPSRAQNAQAQQRAMQRVKQEMQPVPGEPPVPEGMTRLYRGETGQVGAEKTPNPNVSEWLRETPEYKGTVSATGRWFSDNKAAAEYYVKEQGDASSHITYVDVPTGKVNSFLASNQPEAGRWSAAGRAGEEYFVPREVADARRPVAEGQAQPVQPWQGGNVPSTKRTLEGEVIPPSKEVARGAPTNEDIMRRVGVGTEIRRAYFSLTNGAPGAEVPIGEIKKLLSDVPGHEIDESLGRQHRGGDNGAMFGLHPNTFVYRKPYQDVIRTTSAAVDTGPTRLAAPESPAEPMKALPSQQQQGKAPVDPAHDLARLAAPQLGLPAPEARPAEPPVPQGMIRYYHGTTSPDATGFTGKTFVTPQRDYAQNYRGGNNNVLYTDMPKAEAIAKGLYDDINGFPRNGSIDDGAARLRPLEQAAPDHAKVASDVIGWAGGDRKVAADSLRGEIAAGRSTIQEGGATVDLNAVLREVEQPAEPPLPTNVGLDDILGALERSGDNGGLVPPRSPPGPPPARGSLARRIFSPQTVDAAAGRAGASIRREGGIAARETAQAQHALEPFHRVVNALPDPLPVIDYIENRSAGRAANLPREQQGFADTVREVVQQRRARLEVMPSTEGMSFVEDYFPHLWENARQGEAFVRSWKEGSGRNVKERKIPTIADGIRAGLVPRLGPMGTVLHYVDSMDRFIATNTVFDKAKAAGDVRYIPHGRPAPEGWVKVGGRLGERGGATAYAPEGWARVYNNFISRGIHDVNKDIGELYDIAQRGANFLTMVKLGFSGYHFLTMTQEAMVNGLAKGIDEMMSGHPIMAAKSAVTAAAKPVTYALTGKKAQDIYLGQRHRPKMGHNHGPLMETDANDLVDILTEAGARMQGTRHAPDIATSLAGSYVTAWRRGSLKAELAADAAIARGQYGLGALKVGAKHLGRIMSTVAQPLFEKYIPLIKNGAAMEHLAGWLKRHPNATHEEAVAAARDIVDYVDDRFGEMIQDNVFMNKVIKQAGTLALLSWSWRFGGIVRALGQGAADTALAPWRAGRKAFTGSTGPRGKAVWTPQMSYVMALPLVYGMMAAVYQYIKTGEQPEDVRDLMAPRTGGVDDRGEPERLIMPGYMKDVFGFYNDALHEATGGINPALTMAGQSATILGGKGGSDWRDDPILSQPDEDQPWVANVPRWMQQYMAFVAQNALPISLSQTIFAKESEGSNLNFLERGLGVRQAPAWLTTGEDYNPRKPKTKGQFRRESLRSRRQEEGQEQFPSWMRYGGTQ